MTRLSHAMTRLSQAGWRGAVVVIVAMAISSCAGSPSPDGPPATGAGGPSGPARPTPTPTPEADRAAPGTRLQGIEWAGKQRTYVVHAPPTYSANRPLPLVIALHYFPGNAEGMAFMTGLDAKADKEGFVVAYPNGINGAYNALYCCNTTEDDVGFIKALIARMQHLWRVDPDRIYATGISNGADMSYKLAVELPGTFAAIAPVSGAFAGRAVDADPNYAPRTPVSVITFLGRLDGQFRRMEAGVAGWRQRLGCTAGASTPIPSASGVSRSTATCRDGSEFVAYTIAGMAHAWPGGVPRGRLSDPVAGISATDLMWTFFAAHPRRS